MSKGTPLRNVRVSDELWKRALACAAHDKRTVSAVIVAALKEYVSETTQAV